MRLYHIVISISMRKQIMSMVVSKKNVSLSELIIHLARLGLGQEAREDLDSFVLEEDCWKDFLTLAAKEGCTGLIHYNITHHFPDFNVPDQISHQLEQEYLTNVGRNLLIDAQLKEICARFEESKLSVLTIRGAVFFDQIYPEIGIRPLIDMDFVVHAQDFEKVQEILKGLGFENHECYPFFFFKDDIYVDIHLDSINFWRIKDWPSAIDIKNKDLWQRTVSFRGHSCVRALNTYDSILHCCEHLMRHSFDRLIWFVDIAYLVKNEGEVFDWRRMIQRAKEFHAQKAAFYVMSYLEKMNFIDVPSERLVELGDFRMNFLEKRNFRLLMANRRVNLSGDLMSLFAIPGFWLRIQALWNGIFIENEKFPLIRKRLTFFSYICRFFRLFKYIFTKTLSVFRIPKF